MRRHDRRAGDATPAANAALARLWRPRRVAHGHSGVNTYVYLVIHDGTVTGNVQFPIVALNAATGLSFPQDEAGALDTLATHRAEIAGYAGTHLALEGDGWPLQVVFTKHRVLEREAGSYAILEYAIEPPPAQRPNRLRIRFDGVTGTASEHEGLLIVKIGSGFGPVRTESERRLPLNAQQTTHDILVPPSSLLSDLRGAGSRVGAETRELVRRARKRLQR